MLPQPMILFRMMRFRWFPNGSVYQIEGENLDKFGLEAGAGLTLDVGNRLEMAVSYEGKFRKDYTDHSGLVNMKFKF